MADDLDGLLDEQATYYRDRAPEYDLWWRREGMYDGGDAFNRQWHAEIDDLRLALDAFAPRGDVLELAAGTGGWTIELARYADRITAVDLSLETLAINRQKTAGTADIRHVQADVFDWRPDRRYDVVFFSFWLSHVPPSRFDGFWSLVADALAPDGRVFLIDNQPSERDDARETPGMHIRRLTDGREYRIVKVYWTPEELQERLGPKGWSFDGGRTARFFTYAAGTRRRG
jgi:SAM-dependent methyltransferase